MKRFTPAVKFWVGPPLDNGYYYDIDLEGKTLTEEDLAKVEGLMKELAKKDNKYVRTAQPKAEAIKYFTDKGDEYKLDLLNGLTDGEITFYTQGNFTDLCRGPHIPSTGYIKAIKLLNIAGAYWKGDSNNKQLTRIYGITFPKQQMLDEYLAMLEEAKKRDHRILGKELEIFTFDDEVGPGLPLWLPKGGALIEKLEALAKENENAQGYVGVRVEEPAHCQGGFIHPQRALALLCGFDVPAHGTGWRKILFKGDELPAPSQNIRRYAKELPRFAFAPGGIRNLLPVRAKRRVIRFDAGALFANERCAYLLHQRTV